MLCNALPASAGPSCEFMSPSPCRSCLRGRQRKFTRKQERKKTRNRKIKWSAFVTREHVVVVGGPGGPPWLTEQGLGSQWVWLPTSQIELCPPNTAGETISTLPSAVLNFGFLGLSCPRTRDASSIRASLGEPGSVNSDAHPPLMTIEINNKSSNY